MLRLSRFSNIGLPVNWIAADVVRLHDGILVEHWDVIQDEATEEQSKSKAPMFGSTFPVYAESGPPMDKLLKLAVEAHGGLGAWNRLRTLKANVSIGGALWDLKNLAGLFQNTRVDVKLHHQEVVTHLPDLNEKIRFVPHQVSLESEDGNALETRDDPRLAFAGHTQDTPWDKLHVGYFSSYALWGYLTAPFLYTYPGFEAEEVAPGREIGERWRVLKVTFPEEYAAHTRTHYSYFGEDGLLRRHLYRVDILGGAQGANYAYDYRTIERVKLPTRRRVLGYKGDLQKVPAPVLVSIDLSDIAFT